MKVHSAGPVSQVSNLDRALKYYTEVLGFTEDFPFGEYAGVKSGEALLHLCAHDIHKRPVGGGAAFIFCDEVDKCCELIMKKGAVVKVQPEDRPQGMRDFAVLDPDGNHLNVWCCDPSLNSRLWMEWAYPFRYPICKLVSAAF